MCIVYSSQIELAFSQWKWFHSYHFFRKQVTRIWAHRFQEWFCIVQDGGCTHLQSIPYSHWNEKKTVKAKIWVIRRCESSACLCAAHDIFMFTELEIPNINVGEIKYVSITAAINLYTILISSISKQNKIIIDSHSIIHFIQEWDINIISHFQKVSVMGH